MECASNDSSTLHNLKVKPIESVHRAADIPAGTIRVTASATRGAARAVAAEVVPVVGICAMPSCGC